jgi:hypothetical protein
MCRLFAGSVEVVIRSQSGNVRFAGPVNPELTGKNLTTRFRISDGILDVTQVLSMERILIMDNGGVSDLIRGS